MCPLPVALFHAPPLSLCPAHTYNTGARTSAHTQTHTQVALVKRLLAAAGFPAASVRVDVSGPTRGPKLVLVAASPLPPPPAAPAEPGRGSLLRGVRVEDKVDRARLAQVRRPCVCARCAALVCVRGTQGPARRGGTCACLAMCCSSSAFRSPSARRAPAPVPAPCARASRRRCGLMGRCPQDPLHTTRVHTAGARDAARPSSRHLGRGTSLLQALGSHWLWPRAAVCVSVDGGGGADAAGESAAADGLHAAEGARRPALPHTRRVPAPRPPGALRARPF
jgi:hypothetical protein